MPGTAIAQLPDHFFEDMTPEEESQMPTLGPSYKDEPLDLTFFPDDAPAPQPKDPDGKSTSSVVDSLLSSLGKMLESKTGSGGTEQTGQEQPVQRRTAANVLDFDLQGVKLHMTPDEAKRKLQAKGFQVAHANRTYPKIYKVHAREICKDKGAKMLSEIDECMRLSSKNDYAEYISKIKFIRKTGWKKEEITVFFASAMNNNQAYRIDYVDYGDGSLQTDYTALYLKEKRKNDFWQFLQNRFGPPDETDPALIWGGGSVAMRAGLTGSALDARISMADGALIDNEIGLQAREVSQKPAVLTFKY